MISVTSQGRSDEKTAAVFVVETEYAPSEIGPFKRHNKYILRGDLKGTIVIDIAQVLEGGWGIIEISCDGRSQSSGS